MDRSTNKRRRAATQVDERVLDPASVVLFSSKLPRTVPGYEAIEEHRILSNLHSDPRAPVRIPGEGVYAHGEAAFQAGKAQLVAMVCVGQQATEAAYEVLAELRRPDVSPERAKFLGGPRAKRLAWDDSIEELWASRSSARMIYVLRAKFSPGTEARAVLARTAGKALYEYRAARGDRLWGVVPAAGDPLRVRGQNRLGQLLMTVREEAEDEADACTEGALCTSQSCSCTA
jgi:ribA/ribD-fused uncharacterized protein